jgi:hypothetical protein
MEIDGDQIDVPDSDANLKEFGNMEEACAGRFLRFIRSVRVNAAPTGSSPLRSAYLRWWPKLAARLLAGGRLRDAGLADRRFFGFELWAQYLTTGAVCRGG